MNTKRYECVSGYVIAAAGFCEVGDEVEGIGAVQYIVECEDEDEDEGSGN